MEEKSEKADIFEKVEEKFENVEEKSEKVEGKFGKVWKSWGKACKIIKVEELVGKSMEKS